MHGTPPRCVLCVESDIKPASSGGATALLSIIDSKRYFDFFGFLAQLLIVSIVKIIEEYFYTFHYLEQIILIITD